MKANYTAVFYKCEGWWIGRVAEIPGVNTQGKTKKEVRANLKEALLGILELNRELAAKEAGPNAVQEELIVELAS
ncbi:MAG TPA: type II toxin-antitoxin system HicB family antitoxin [Planctomycetota bacterium]